MLFTHSLILLSSIPNASTALFTTASLGIVLEITQGNPFASASTNESPNPSKREGKQKISIACK